MILIASNAGDDLKSSVSGLKVKPKIEIVLFSSEPSIYSANNIILFGRSALMSKTACNNGVLISFFLA